MFPIFFLLIHFLNRDLDARVFLVVAYSAAVVTGNDFAVVVEQNARRKAKGEAPLKELKKEDEDAIAAEPDKTKPEDDAYLSETGRILLDYLKISKTVAKQ